MWYSASLFFEEMLDTDGVCALWEEQIVLISAESDQAARERAVKIGSSKEHRYTSANENVVRWKFRGVERLFPIEGESIADGIELFSRFLRETEAKSILKAFD